jgi:hypothetical protein
MHFNFLNTKVFCFIFGLNPMTRTVHQNYSLSSNKFGLKQKITSSLYYLLKKIKF